MNINLDVKFWQQYCGLDTNMYVSYEHGAKVSIPSIKVRINYSYTISTKYEKCIIQQ
jgi:hypothetical protein